VEEGVYNEVSFQDGTGRVRQSSGHNDAVCAVNEKGVPEWNAIAYSRRIMPETRQTNGEKRKWLFDFDKNNVFSAHWCGGSGWCTKRDHEQGQLEDFELSDISAHRWTNEDSGSKHVAVPSGGVNREFLDASGKACSALGMTPDCKSADAAGKSGQDLTNFLSKFCDTPAALYEVPKNSSGLVPEGFGHVERPLPYLPEGNYRRFARANFWDENKGGEWLFCKDAECGSSPAPAVQGTLEDVVAKSGSSPGKWAGEFYPTVGGAANMDVPSAVPTEWLDFSKTEAGIVYKDISENHAASTSAAATFAKSLVEAEKGRSEGVTCVNGKYVYARHGPGNSRPVVSTVREGQNRQGPYHSWGVWTCRYLGVFCNTNQCTNDGDVDIPGPFTEPAVTPR